MKTKSVFSTNLRSVIEKGSHTQRKLAEMLSIDSSTIQRWLTEKSFPSPDNLDQLCLIYGISLETLFKSNKETPYLHNSPKAAIELLANELNIDLTKTIEVTNYKHLLENRMLTLEEFKRITTIDLRMLTSSDPQKFFESLSGGDSKLWQMSHQVIRDDEFAISRIEMMIKAWPYENIPNGGFYYPIAEWYKKLKEDLEVPSSKKA